MRVAVYLPFVLSAVLGIVGPVAVRRMPPATATRLLLGCAVVSTVSSLFALLILAFTRLGQLELVAALGNWSHTALASDDPVPPAVATTAVATLVVLTVTTAVALVRRAHAAAILRRDRHGLGCSSSDLIVVDDANPDAFTLPGGLREPGRIVVTRGMMQALNAAERAALLAHEAAHLRSGHHHYRTLIAVLRAMNPLLYRLPASVHYLTERWADERAAGNVGDRRLVARALARAALARKHHRQVPEPQSRLCFHRNAVSDRARSMLAPPPARRPLVAAVLIAVVAVNLAASNEMRRDSASLFAHAMRAPHHHLADWRALALALRPAHHLRALHRIDPAAWRLLSSRLQRISHELR